MAKTTIHSDYIPDNAITGVKIAENSITAREIATNAITSLYVADDSVTADKLANSINTDIALGVAALPKAGGTMTGNLNIIGGASDMALTVRNSASGTSSSDGLSITVENPTPDVAIRQRENANMKFYTNNTERLRIDANGKIFMNEGLPFSWTDSSLNVSAEIYGDSSDNLVFRNTSSKTERMRIDSAGNINIGTTAKSNSYPARFITTSLATPSSGGEACHILELVGRRNQNAGNQNGMIQFWNTTSTAAETARISGIQGTGLNSGALTFATYAAGTYDEAMRIDQDGKVGIGTNNPLSKLHVASGLGRNAGGTARFGKNAGHGLFIHSDASSSSHYNWIITTQDTVNKGFEIIPSDSAGGTQFTTPAFIIIADTRNVGIGTNSPTEKLDINGGAVIKGGLTNGSGTGSALRMQHSSNISEILSLEPGVAWRELRTNASQQTFYIAGGEKMILDSNGNLGIGATTPNDIYHKENTSITATQSTGNSWSTPSSAGTYSVQGAIEAAGIRNRHVAKWALSGNLSANTWYPFVKRSELAGLTNDTGSNSEAGYGMYFRIYTYLSASGYGEYFSNRVSSTIWVTNNGSNSTQTHELYVGPGWGHAPNGGHDVNTASNSPFRLRIAHHNGSDSTWGGEQTVEIRCAAALSGLNSSVTGRQLMIYGYII